MCVKFSKKVIGTRASTDVADCAWLAQLLEHGLLRSSFVPPAPIRELLSEQTIYRELGIDYFDRYRAERLNRRSLAQLQRLGYQVSLTPLPTAA